METLKTFLELKKEISESIATESAAYIGQYFSDARQDIGRMIEVIKTENAELIKELKEVVYQYKQETDSRLNKFDVKIAELESMIERRLWPKWVMSSMIIGMFCMFALNVILLLKN